MGTITKKDLIERISEDSKLKRDQVRDVVQLFLDSLVDELAAGNRIEFRDFGVFEVRTRAGRIAQNPRTMQRVDVPPKKTVRFKIGRLMREKMTANGSGGSNGTHFEPKV
jgi:integration host factor subunit beta